MIGTGGFADVYKALRYMDDRYFALKKFKFKIDDMYREDVEVARREIENLQQLDHPFLVKLEDCFKDHEGCVYIALEYMQHGSLQDILNTQK